jgi:ribosome biogenesis protein YTM1
MSFSLAANVLATAHPDKTVRMWDPRHSASAATGSKEVIKAQYRSHTGWVSGVQFHPSPTQPHLFASTGYDSTVRLWDLRSTRVPRQTIVVPLPPNAPPQRAGIVAAQQKMLCIDWHNE